MFWLNRGRGSGTSDERSRQISPHRGLMLPAGKSDTAPAHGHPLSCTESEARKASWGAAGVVKRGFCLL